MTTMNILVATNDGYVMPTKVMIKSLELSQDSKVNVAVYVLYSELNDDSFKNLDSLNSRKQTFAIRYAENNLD